MSNKTHVTFGTCQKVASLEALIKWQQSLCSDVCAVVHERFTPCLLQNKVVSCSMRLNLFCLDTRLHNTDNEPFTCQLLIKIMQILTNVSTKGGSCNPCFQWGLGLGWSRRGSWVGHGLNRPVQNRIEVTQAIESGRKIEWSPGQAKSTLSCGSLPFVRIYVSMARQTSKICAARMNWRLVCN